MKEESSMTTGKPSKVTVLEEKIVTIPRKKARKGDHPIIQVPAQIPPLIPEKEKKTIPDTEILAMMMAVSRILAPRMLVFLSLLAAFVLALLTVMNPETPRIVAFSLYCMGIVWPMSMLYFKGK